MKKRLFFLLPLFLVTLETKTMDKNKRRSIPSYTGMVQSNIAALIQQGQKDASWQAINQFRGQTRALRIEIKRNLRRMWEQKFQDSFLHYRPGRTPTPAPAPR